MSDADRSRRTAWRTVIAGLLAGALLPAAGCGTKATKKKVKKASAGPVAEETLPAIDADSVVTVDAGRIAVASPAGWARAPRSKDYLVRYTPTAQKTYPSITVTAAEPPAGFTKVTAANQQEFVTAVAATLAETFTADGKSTLLKQPAPLTIGEHVGVGWTAPGTAQVGSLKEPIDVACLAFVVGGRLVTVETRAPKGKLDDKGRAAGKAVAAAIALPKPVEPETPPAAPAAPPTEVEAKSDEPASVTSP